MSRIAGPALHPPCQNQECVRVILAGDLAVPRTPYTTRGRMTISPWSTFGGDVRT